MRAPPQPYFDIICEVLAPRCGGGRATVAALGRPRDAGCYDRWSRAGLLSDLEADRLRAQVDPLSLVADDIRALLDTTQASTSSAEWGWGATDVERTVMEALTTHDDPTQVLSQFKARFSLRDTVKQTRFFDVMRARDEMLGRDCVVHRYRDDSGLGRAAFIDQVRLQAGLQHANIQPVYEIVDDPKQGLFYVTSLNLDRSLSKVLRGVATSEAVRNTWTTLRRLEVLLDVARAVAFAHRRNVVHRDLRPRQIRLGNFGEVHVAGWFRARRRSEQPDEIADALRHMVDSGLGYLAPERLQDGLHVCGPAADVWGLGALLYAALTWRPPFAGRSSTELVAEFRRGQVVRPSLRARRASDVPEAIEGLCMEALVVNPERRRLSAEEFATELEDFLDGTRAEARRLEQAEELLEDAHNAVESFQDARHTLYSLIRADAESRASEALMDHAGGANRRTVIEARRDDVVKWFFRADELFNQTLAALPGYEPARYGLSALHYLGLQDTERGFVDFCAPYLRANIRQLDPGMFADALDARAHLELRTYPRGLTADFHQLREDNGIIRMDGGRRVGATPFVMNRLRPGAYVIRLSDEHGRSATACIWLRPHERLKLLVTVPDSVPEGFVLVPAGPAVTGVPGPEGVRLDALPHGRVNLPGFFIAKHPVSLGEYGEFLNALWADSPERAARHAPRPWPGIAAMWTPGAEGYQLPLMTPDGQIWTARHPAVGLRTGDVEAYLAWRSTRDGCQYRLPLDTEWAKAARGADGRIYPWGSRPEPAWCHHLGSPEGPRAPRPLGRIRQDTSVYGVRDVAGSVREYTASFAQGTRVLRGGAWILPFSECHLAARAFLNPATPLLSLGFRLVLDGPDGPPPRSPEIHPMADWPMPAEPSPFRPTRVSMMGLRSEELTVAGRSILNRAEPPPEGRRKHEQDIDLLDPGPARYTVLEEIARGSMGRVVLAYDDVLERHVALKVLHDKHQDDTLSRYRFIMEARITGRLQHTTMVPIYDMGVLPDGARFFAMRPIDGLSLHDVLRARARGDRRTLTDYNRDRLLTVLRRVCQGVGFAHEHHVVHRDLKPANIIVGDYGEVVIVDLGLARQLRPEPTDHTDVEEAVDLARDDGRVTRVGSVIGTPYYMSPEQAMGLQDLVGPAADIYGLGAILYHVLTNRPPFAGKKVNEVLAKVRRGNPRPPSHVAPDQDVETQLDEIVMRALAMNPEHRQASAMDLALEMRQFQERSRLQEKEAGILRQRVERARDAAEQLDTMIAQVGEAEQRLRAIRQERVADPVEYRRRLWEAQELARTRAEQVQAQRATCAALTRLAAAVEPSMGDTLVRLLQTQHETAADPANRREYARRLRALDDGTLEKWLLRGATLRVDTSPSRLPSAIVLADQGGRLQTDRPIARGPSPLRVDLATPVRGAVSISARGGRVWVPFAGVRGQDVEVNVAWPRSVPKGFIVVLEGRFTYGALGALDPTADGRQVRLPTFLIGQHPVTCGEYEAFLKSLPEAEAAARRPRIHGTPLWEGTLTSLFGAFDATRPVTGVTLSDANAYAQWRSRRDHCRYRLPTSQEWEKAARGTDARLLPWGDRFEPAYFRDASNLGPVGSYPEDISPYGMQDVATGVFEWTSSAAREDANACVLRGACNAFPLHEAPVVQRGPWPPTVPSPFIGFRLLLDAEPPVDRG